MDHRPHPSPGSASLPRPDRTRPKPKTADSDRKRGTYSYHRFDDRVCGPASVGGEAFGNVQVDLKWKFRQLQWGCNDGDRPAGVLYLDIGLHEQADYKLVSITVEVTLEYIPTDESGDDGDRNRYREIQVQMTDWFGPTQMVGREDVQYVTKESKFQPTSFEGSGSGIGDIDKSLQSPAPVRSCWEFAGRLERPNRTESRSAGGTHYKTLQWTVSENELEPGRDNTTHIAFTFEHGGQPFHMHAKVEGTLRSQRDCLLSGLRDLRFGPRRDRPGDVPTTYVGVYSGYRMPLDELGKGLDLAMQERNRRFRPLRAFSATGSPVVERGQEASDSAQQARPALHIAAQRGRELTLTPIMAPPDTFQYMSSTPGSGTQDVLERLSMAGQRFAGTSVAQGAPDDRPGILNTSAGPGRLGTAIQPPSAVSSLARPPAASVVSRMSSVTLVDQADQAAAIDRLPLVAKRQPSPSPPPASRMAMLPPKGRRSLFGILRAWVVATIRLYLFFMVGIPLRCLRLGISIVAAAVRLVGATERRVSQVLTKHARI